MKLRDYGRWLRRTPLHPQWLMPKRAVDIRIKTCCGRVLDIGSADQWLSKELDSDSTYVAFDYPATAVNLYGTRPDVFGDARYLPFASASFQAVACYEVLEHVCVPEDVLAEIARVLAPGGTAELTMPFLYPVHDAPYDYQRWTRHRWAQAVSNVGLRIDSIKAVNPPLHSAAVMACLALAGPLQSVSRLSQVCRLPVVLALVPTINLAAWLLTFLWPAWEAITTGHRVLIRKPG